MMDVNVSSEWPHDEPGRPGRPDESVQSYALQAALHGRFQQTKKRKAESQDNERLSKRLSLLNLEQKGQKLYVPVESPRLRPADPATLAQVPEGDAMQLDESKHKVYIYDMDAELADGAEADDGRLVFLPDIEKHLLQKRIPPYVLAPKEDDLSGMQVVLYNEPTSLTIPEEQDSVRRAIIETRARARRKQRGEPEPVEGSAAPVTSDTEMATDGPRVPNGLHNLANDPLAASSAMTDSHSWPHTYPPDDPDPDAMDMD